ncbi:MAG: hypothetical protein KJO38_12595 [Gammaproteobacteria bacterium]|nr:hypothetical protein [Gammaproteobacteria bacterium]
MKHRTIRGRILYTSKKPERMDEERGREWFDITVHGDGSRTLRAHCEIDDAPSVLRDITLSLDANWHPRDCFVRLTIDDRFEGSGWMRFTDSQAECEVINARDGRISQRLDLAEPIRWLGSHPIVSDGMCFSIYDRGKGSSKTFFPNMMLTSPDHRGATGPLLFPLGFGLQYIGDETITVGAGTFEAHHFCYVDTAGQLPEEHPPYEVWCSADGDFIFLKGGVGGYMQTYYELVELGEY